MASPPSTMKGWSYDSFGPIAKVLHLGSLDVPPLLGADDVLIRVIAAAINPTDTKQIQGSLAPLLVQDRPMKPGMDFAGVVEKRGERAADRFKIGDEVFGMVRGVRTGTTCEYIVVDQYSVSLKPKQLSFVDAAAIPLASMTAMQCLLEVGFVTPPDESAKNKSVLITGGPGGVGMFAIQLAKQMFGIGRVVTTASTKKVQLCKDLGADEVIDYTKQNFATAVGSEQFDGLVDCTGDAWSMMALAKPHGAVVSILNAPTKDILTRWRTENMGENPGMTIRGPVDFAIQKIPAPVVDFFTGALFYRLRGHSQHVRYNHLICIPNHDHTDAIAALVVAGKVRVVIDQVFAFEQADQAYLRVDSGKAVGKVVVKIVP